MVFSVVRTTTFKVALDKVFDYIIDKFKNPKIIDDMLTVIDKSCDLLTQFPEAFTEFRPAYTLLYQYRYFKVKKYKVFYRIDYEARIIYLETIVHSLQDVDNKKIL